MPRTARNRTRLRRGLTATALLAAAALVPAPAHAEDVTDCAVTVDPGARGAAIDDTMYGVFFEDINRAADGGLYAELVRNRSFGYSTADHASYAPLTSWTADGAAEVVDDSGRLNERNRNYLSLGAGSSVTNAGYNTGIRVGRGKRYDFSVWTRAASGSTLTVSLKGTVGPVEERATNANFWGCDRSYGLGCYEYFRFAEDIGAMPLPVVPALVTGCGRNESVDDDVKVTAADGSTLLDEDFPGDASRWKHNGTGSWSIQDGRYVQTDPAAENTMVTAGDPARKDYDLHVRATKKSGDEGFLVAIGVKDTGTCYWWNPGGWNNTRSAVEQAVDGGKDTLLTKPGSIETGRAYDIDVKVRGRQVALYLDGEKWGEFTDDKPAEPFRRVVTEDTRTGDLIVKVVDAQEAAARTPVDLGGLEVAPTARVTTLAADADAVNTETDTPVTPVTSTFRGVAGAFTYTFPANSVTFLRIRQR